MTWNDTLYPRQEEYAGSSLLEHSVLLARPGTGKTYSIIRRVALMVQENEISPSDILVISFTKAATAELKVEFKRYFGEINDIPTPMHVLNDWEEHKIIFEELKKIINISKNDVEKHFRKISADFDNLHVENEDVDAIVEEGEFFSVWQNHRKNL